MCKAAREKLTFTCWKKEGDSGHDHAEKQIAAQIASCMANIARQTAAGQCQ